MRLTLRLLSIPLLLMGGCASVSVMDIEKDLSEIPQQPPTKIYVMDFNTKDGDYEISGPAKEVKRIKKDVAEQLSLAIADRCTENLAPAERWIYPKRKLPKSGWLIKGDLEALTQGNRALRATIGFGAGATKLETSVEIYDLSISREDPFLSFDTTGGTNGEPGLLSPALDPLSFAGTKGDIIRTARMIVATLSEYMKQQNIPTTGRPLQPKKAP